MTQPDKMSSDAYDLHAEAETALDEARRLSPGSEKTEALKMIPQHALSSFEPLVNFEHPANKQTPSAVSRPVRKSDRTP